MHELPITESILEIALRHARQSNAKRITGIYLVIGQMSSVVDDSVQFYWDMISKDTMAAGAKLYFERIPAKMLCLDCKYEFIPGEEFSCPICQSLHVKVVAGEEFRLEAIDVDD
jgi:hydrogenase nickel incorporation protein HypA/HybF